MKNEPVPRLSTIDTLSNGFTQAARHPWLMMVPLLTQLVLWVMPRFCIAPLIELLTKFSAAMLRSSATPSQLPKVEEMLASMQQLSTGADHMINLADGLAGSWLGVPNIMALNHSRLTFLSDVVLQPAGLPVFAQTWAAPPGRLPEIEIGNLGLYILLSIGFWLVGQFLAAVYLRALGNAYRPDRYWAGVGGLLRLTAWVMLFGLLLEVLFFGLSLALLFALGMMWMAGSSPLTIVMVLSGGFVLWLALWCMVSLFYVGEAMVLERNNLLRALWRSLSVAQRNFWPTLGLCIVANLLIYGFRPIWGVIGQSPFGVVTAILANSYLVTGISLGVFTFYDHRVRQAVTQRIATTSR